MHYSTYIGRVVCSDYMLNGLSLVMHLRIRSILPYKSMTQYPSASAQITSYVALSLNDDKNPKTKSLTSFSFFLTVSICTSSRHIRISMKPNTQFLLSFDKSNTIGILIIFIRTFTNNWYKTHTFSIFII